MSIWIFFKLIGALALLMFGMKTMSDSLQKMAGPQLRHVLGTMTTNRLTGILTGTLITAAVQSSTATTVMTVSFVNAGLLTLAQAISVIMGANIGTTLTAWIMSAGFSFNITDFVWPAFFIAIILIYSKKRKIIGDFIFGISFMFLGLGTLRQTGIDMDLAHNQPVLEFFASFDPHSFQTTITFLIIGSILTMCVQSSAAVMAITMILCSTGVLPIYQGIALVMGENIGTTVTSNVAALTANTQARRAAMAHMVFNIFGVLWILCIFHPFIHLVCGWVGFDDAMEKTDPHFVANATKLSFVLAAFHTTFNLANTFILVWFIPQIEKLVCKIIRPKKNTDEDDFRLRFIQSGIMKTPEISVLEAQKEIHCFAERIQRMFGMVKTLLGETNEEKFVKNGLSAKFVQDNEVYSGKGVLRGFGINTKVLQTKLIRVLNGKIYDVVIDLRADSKTFMKSFCVELSAKNGKQLYIPEGFAHAYLALEDSVIFFKVTSHFILGDEIGFSWNSKFFNMRLELSICSVVN